MIDFRLQLIICFCASPKFTALIAALDTDLAWVEVHTRLLMRAKEWEREAKNGSFLLRGKDLVEAEQWTAKSAEKEPALTTLQSQYTLAGRQASTRRQRIVMGSVAAALVVAVGLAIFAFIQKKLAQDEARIANSGRLAATARLLKDDQLDLASLLSLEAVRTAENFESRDALLAVYESNPRLLTYLHSPSVPQSVAFSPDGKTIASGSADGTVRLWNVAGRRLACQPLSGHSQAVASVAFSQDGRTLASGSFDRTVRLWDVRNRKALGQPLTGHKGAVMSVAFSGGTLASGSQDGTVRLWDVANQQALGEPLTGHRAQVWSLAFSPDGNTLASAAFDKTVRLWDVASHQALGEPLTGHSGSVTSVAFSPNGAILASGSQDTTVRLWDVANRQPLGEPLTGHLGGVSGVAFSPDGLTLVSAGSQAKLVGIPDNTLRLWDVASRQPIGEPLKGHNLGVIGRVVQP